MGPPTPTDRDDNARMLIERFEETLRRVAGAVEAAPAGRLGDGETAGVLSWFEELGRLAIREATPEPGPGPIGPEGREGLSTVVTPEDASSQGQPLIPPFVPEAGDPAIHPDRRRPLGRFVVLELHAKGGLGQVSRAFDEDVRRTVALKEIREPWADDPEARRRFVAEAEITGQLEHPGVVPIYALGLAPDGRPFYAMRFIGGRTLSEAITAHHEAPTALGLRDLLQQFVAICRTVSYAHSRSVVHRDLKPSNVVLGDFGEAIVLDWGIAKRLGKTAKPSLSGEADPSGSGTATEKGSVLGTPAYMPPEQARGEPDAARPSADVYALGAILYTILAGRPPYLGASGSDILVQLFEGPPQPPSQVAKGMPKALEAVCLKAIARDADDRYPGAEALARDVERWLADEPVSACREPWADRARRWARRNRSWVLAGSASLVVALIGLMAVVAVQERANVRLSMARDAEADAHRRADSRFRLALEAVRQYHTGVGREALLKQPEMSELRERLLRPPIEFYERLRRDLEADARRDTGALTALAEAYANLGTLTDSVGSTSDALASYRSAVEILDALVRRSPEDLRLMRRLADARNAAGTLEKATGGIEEAEASYRAASALHRELVRLEADPDSDRAGLATCLSNLGNLLSLTDRLDEAGRCFDEALEIRARLAENRPSDPDRQLDHAEILHNLALHRLATGQTPEAVDAQRKALEIDRMLVARHPDQDRFLVDLAQACQNLAMLVEMAGQVDEAEALYIEASGVQRRLAEEDPAISAYQADLARCLNNLGQLHVDTGMYDLAADRLDEALGLFRDLVEAHPDVPTYRSGLAASLLNRGGLAQALGRLEDARDNFRESLGHHRTLADLEPGRSEHRRAVAIVHNNLGSMAYQAGRLDEAEASFRDTLEIRERLAQEFPDDDEIRAELATARNNLGAVIDDAGRPGEAEPLLLDAIAEREALADGHPDWLDLAIALGGSHSNLGDLRARLGEPREAVQSFDRAIEILRDASGRDPRDVKARRLLLDSRLARAVELARLGRVGEASDEARALAGSPTATVFVWNEAARAFSLASADARARGEAGEADRLADEGLQILGRIPESGYVATSEDWRRFEQDPDMRALRDRADARGLDRRPSVPEGR